MNDVCACEWEPDDIATVYERVERRARKRHQCVECDHCILPGHQYIEIRMLFEGQWTTDRICEVCARVGDDLCCGAWPLAALWEHIRESAFETWSGDDEEDDDWDWCSPGPCGCDDCAPVTKQ